MAADDQNTADDARELLELDVAEVSMVDKPAIRRKFVMVKRDTDTGEDQVDNDDNAADTGDDNATDTGDDKTDTADDKTDTGDDNATDDNPETITADAQKQAMPLLTQLATERLSAVSERVGTISTELASGTLTKERADDLFRGLSSMLWDAQDDVVSVAKSVGISEEVTAAFKVDTTKADRRMTQRRRTELKGAIDSLTKLLSELETEMAAEDTDKTDTDKTDTGIDADAIGAAVTAAVSTAIEPITTRLDAMEAKAAGATDKADDKTDTADDKTDTDKAETDLTKAITAAVTKALEPVTQRLDSLEAAPGTTGQDTTDTETQKDNGKAGSSKFWGGASVSLGS